MKKHITSIAAAGLALCSTLTTAHAEGHYVPGVEGLQAASAPPPGLYYLGYLVNYDIHSFRAPGGSGNLPGSNSGNVTALANRLVWMTGAKVLGADYGVETIIPVIGTSLHLNAAGVNDSHTGLGDIYVGPVVLSWHGGNWDAVGAAGVWLDNARANTPADPGKGFKSWMLTGGGTYYFDAAKNWSGSALARFERNTRSDAGFRYGNQLTVEWGLGKRYGVMQGGLVGYSQWQLTNDSGPGAGDARSARHAIGAEFSYALPAQKMNLKAALYQEVSAKAGSLGPQPRGTLLRLGLVKAF